MGNHGRALPERQALERACRQGKPELILSALRDLHHLQLARITDDATATAALAAAGDPRWRLAAGQLLAALTRALRRDLEGADEVMSVLEGLPDTASELRKIAMEASGKLAGPSPPQGR